MLLDSIADVLMVGLHGKGSERGLRHSLGLREATGFTQNVGLGSSEAGPHCMANTDPLDSGQLLRGAGSMTLCPSSSHPESLIDPAHPYF